MKPWPAKPIIHSFMYPSIAAGLHSLSGPLAPQPACVLAHPTELSTGQIWGPGPGLWKPVLPFAAQASQMTSNLSVTQSSGLWLGSPGEGN